MMLKIFVVYGTALILAFGYASYTGWDVADSISSGKWSPTGHSAYHK